MASSPPNISPDVVQLIIALLVVFGTAIAALLRRLDRWIQAHRFPQPDSRPGEEGSGSSPGAPPPASQRPVIEEEEAEDPQTVLMRELERALLGAERRRLAAPHGAEGELPPPTRSSTGSFASGPSPAEQSAMAPPPPAAATRQPATLPAPSRAPRTMPQTAASVSRRRFAHLALLHSPTDLRNALVLSEILGKPACYRRLGWRFPR